MEVIYLANVGTRDVTYKSNWLENPRKEGEELLNNYDYEKENLDAPILIPGIQHVLRFVDKIERLYFFVTEQPKYISDNYRSKDTVFLGKILEYFIPEKFGSKIGEVHVESITGNPANYNEMLEFYGKSIKSILDMHSNALAYVAPVGGVDACNVGLIINSIRYFKESCQPIYIFPDGKAEIINLHKNILEDYTRKQAEAFLNRYDFEAFTEVASNMPGVEDWVFYLSEYALNRLHFDFEKAKEALERAYNKVSGESKLYISKLQRSVEPFLTEIEQPTSDSEEEKWEEWLECQRYLIAEVYYNLLLKAERGEWVDFLGRLFRIQEAVLRYVFENETRYTVNCHINTY